MKEYSMPFGIKLSPAHFPEGTTFKVDELEYHKGKVFTAKRVIRNGYTSYVVETTTLNEGIGANDCYHGFHLSHITEIVKRGNGPVVMGDGPFTSRQSRVTGLRVHQAKMQARRLGVRTPSFKTHYVFGPYIDEPGMPLGSALCEGLIPPDSTLNWRSLRSALLAQTFFKTTVPDGIVDWRLRAYDTYRAAPKKRVNRWLQQNINRFLTSSKKAQVAYDVMMTKDYYDQMETDFDRQLEAEQG